MAWGDYVQRATSGHINRYYSNQPFSADITTTSDHPLVFLFFTGWDGLDTTAISAQLLEQGENGYGDTGGHIWTLIPISMNGASATGTNRVRLWYTLAAGPETFNVTIKAVGTPTVPTWSELCLYEFEADATTIYDSTAAAHHRNWRGYPNVCAPRKTNKDQSFSIFWCGNGYTSHIQDWDPVYWVWPETHQHTLIGYQGAHKFTGTLGSNAATAVPATVHWARWTERTHLHDYNNLGPVGLDNGYAIITPWIHGAAASVPIPLVEKTTTFVNSDTFTTTVPSVSFTISPAPVAGNFLHVFVAWQSNPGVITRDDFLADGWTLWYDGNDGTAYLRVYTKQARGGDDTSLTLTGTNAVAVVGRYEEYAGVDAVPVLFPADSPTLHTGYGGNSAYGETTDQHVVNIDALGEPSLWILYVYGANGYTPGGPSNYTIPVPYISPGTWTYSGNMGSTAVGRPTVNIYRMWTRRPAGIRADASWYQLGGILQPGGNGCGLLFVYRDHLSPLLTEENVKLLTPRVAVRALPYDLRNIRL